MTNAPWSAREGLATAVFQDKLWVLGGGNVAGTTNDIWWTTNGTDWVFVPTNANPRWSGRMGAGCLVYSNRLWIMGGATTYSGSGNPVRDVWSSTNGANWDPTTNSAGWSARFNFGVAVQNNRMLVLGGRLITATEGRDIYASTNGADWELANSTPQWSERQGFGCTVHAGKLWVLGGVTGANTANSEVWWSVDGASNWTNAPSSPGWPQRYYHKSCAIDGRLWVLGGFVPNAPTNDVWQSANGTNWQRAVSPLIWSARYNHGVAVYRDRIWVLSGTSSNDIWRSSALITTVSGTVAYPGPLTGKVYVTASGPATNRTVEASPDNTFSIASLPPSQSYTISAFLDSNTNQIQDSFEAVGTYMGNPVVESVTGITITLTNSPFDSDADGLPDYWELAYFGNRTSALADADVDADGLTNMEEYQLGTNPTNRDTDSDGVTDGDEARKYFTDPLVPNGKLQSQFYYDRDDRLIAAYYTRGSNICSIIYVYDGNGNIVRQKTLAGDSNNNGLPDGWEMLNGLTNNASAYADSDGDGWSDYQEWRAGSNPVNAGSIPTANIVQTAPIAVVLPATNTLGNFAAVTVRLWDAEGNASTPFLQYQIPGATNWQNATLVTLDSAAYSPNVRVTAPPSGANHVLIWNALTNLGPGVMTNILLRTSAQDVTLSSAWSGGVPFTIQTTSNPDSDGDGIPDWWEMQYFGTLSQDPGGDFDNDGMSNYAEYIADTDPRDRNSYLRITSAQVSTNGIQINWSGGVLAQQFLQRISSLGGTNTWVNIQAAQPPTAINGSFMDGTATNGASFYRIRVQRP